MISFNNRTLICVVALLLASNSAFSACKQTDMKGNWVAYVTGVKSQSAERCIVAINKTGGISGQCTDIGSGYSFNIANGLASLDASCHLTGYMTFAVGGTAYMDAQLSLDKASSTGVYTNTLGDIGTFSAQKR
jgi:hypothetical protein